jgi:hypothetical protein
MARKPKKDEDDRIDLTPLYHAEQLCRGFIEQVGADAVVVVWTTQSGRATKYWRHQLGNAMLCNALVTKTSEQQEESECETEEEEEDDD